LDVEADGVIRVTADERSAVDLDSRRRVEGRRVEDTIGAERAVDAHRVVELEWRIQVDRVPEEETDRAVPKHDFIWPHMTIGLVDRVAQRTRDADGVAEIAHHESRGHGPIFEEFQARSSLITPGCTGAKPARQPGAHSHRKPRKKSTGEDPK